MINSGICLLAKLIDRLRSRSLSAEEEKSARLCLLDTLSCGVYGSSMPEAALFVSGIRDMGATGNIPLWGSGELLSVENAALLEGAFCHLRELDDVHYAIVHTGSVCVPTAFSMALKEGATLGALLSAMVCGVEATVRVAKSMDYLEHRERGWHGTATCGSFGAAAAAAVLLDLDAELLANAMGIAGSRTGGSWAFAADGALTKRLHPGLAARDGIVSAFLARAGVKGPHYILEAEDGGFLNMASGSNDMAQLSCATPKLAIQEIEYKWFASCKSVHSPISAALQIQAQRPFADVGDIEDITVEVNRSALSMAGRNYDQNSIVSAQLSIPYGVALGLTGHGGRAGDYTPATLKRPELRALADKTRVLRTDEFDEIREREHKSACRVTVRWTDGQSLSAKVTEPKGAFANPLTREDVIHKSLELLGSVLGAQQAQNVARVVLESGLDCPVETLLPMIIK